MELEGLRHRLVETRNLALRLSVCCNDQIQRMRSQEAAAPSSHSLFVGTGHWQARLVVLSRRVTLLSLLFVHCLTR